MFRPIFRATLCHAIRAVMTNPSRLIVASDNADAQLWREVLNLGAYGVLSKPFESAEVFEFVSSAWRAWNYNEVIRLHKNCERADAPSESLLSMPPNRKTAGRAVHIQQQLRAICG